MIIMIDSINNPLIFVWLINRVRDLAVYKVASESLYHDYIICVTCVSSRQMIAMANEIMALVHPHLFSLSHHSSITDFSCCGYRARNMVLLM
jgi:hypothetical protein